MDNITMNCIQLAAKWYSKNKLAHSVRVANYAVQEAKILGLEEDEIEKIFQIAILHDILEDTECPENDAFNCLFFSSSIKALVRLTHNPEETYDEYILRCSDDNISDLSKVSTNREALAHATIVKRADMKDHLMLEETLSDKLKEKYFPIVKYLL